MSIIPRPQRPVNRFRSLADLARNGCDEYGDLVGPEAEPTGPHFGPTEEDWRDYECWSVAADRAGAAPTDFHQLVALAVGTMQGMAMRLRTSCWTAEDNAAAAERLEALAAQLDAARRAALKLSA
jgi:hypothetical protein